MASVVSTTSGNTTNTTLDTMPTSFQVGYTPQDGDEALLTAHYGGSSLTVSTPAGWTAASGFTNPQTQGTASRMYSFRRTMVSGDSAPTLSFSGFITGGWTMTIVRDTAGFAQAVASSGSGTSLANGSLTGVKANSFLVGHIHGRVASGTIPTGWNPPGTYTETVDHATSRATTAQNVRMEAATRAITTAGTYGGDTFTVANTVTVSAISILAEFLVSPSDSDTGTVTDTEQLSQSDADAPSFADTESSLSISTSDTDAPAVTESEQQAQSGTDSLSVAEAESLVLADADTMAVSDTSQISQADTDTPAILDAESLVASSSDSETLSVADAYMSTSMTDTDTAGVVDSESIDTGSTTASDSDMLAVTEVQSIAIVDADAFTVTDAALQDLIDTELLALAESEMVFVSDIDEFTLADNHSIELLDDDSLSMVDDDVSSADLVDDDLLFITDDYQLNTGVFPAPDVEVSLVVPSVVVTLTSGDATAVLDPSTAGSDAGIPVVVAHLNVPVMEASL